MCRPVPVERGKLRHGARTAVPAPCLDTPGVDRVGLRLQDQDRWRTGALGLGIRLDDDREREARTETRAYLLADGPTHVRFFLVDPKGDTFGTPVHIRGSRATRAQVTVQPITHTLTVTTPTSVFEGLPDGVLSTSGRIVVNTGGPAHTSLPPSVSVVMGHTRPPHTSLCRTLNQNS